MFPALFHEMLTAALFSVPCSLVPLSVPFPWFFPPSALSQALFFLVSVFSFLFHTSCSLFRSWFSLPAIQIPWTFRSILSSGLAFSLPYLVPFSFASLCPLLYSQFCTVYCPAFSLPYFLIQFPFPLLCCVPCFITVPPCPVPLQCQSFPELFSLPASSVMTVAYSLQFFLLSLISPGFDCATFIRVN